MMTDSFTEAWYLSSVRVSILLMNAQKDVYSALATFYYDLLGHHNGLLYFGFGFQSDKTCV
jgi:hypothetical protein